MNMRCIVCGEEIPSDSTPIKGLEAVGFCTEHQTAISNGMIAIIEGVPVENGVEHGGRVVMMMGDAWSEFFDDPLPPLGFVFAPKSLIDHFSEQLGHERASAPSVQ